MLADLTEFRKRSPNSGQTFTCNFLLADLLKYASAARTGGKHLLVIFACMRQGSPKAIHKYHFVTAKNTPHLEEPLKKDDPLQDTQVTEMILGFAFI